MTKDKNNLVYDREYFDRHYKSKLYKWYITTIRNRIIKNVVSKWKKKGRVLEIGFGDDNLLQLFDDDFEIYGVDISEYAVNGLISKYKSENFKLCDITKGIIPFPCQFDVICAINVIEHLPDPEYSLKNIYSSLKEDGLFVVHMPLKNNILSRIQYRIFYDVPEHIYQPSFDSLNSLMDKVGFKLIKKFVPTLFPLKIGDLLIINSSTLFLGIYRKKAYTISR